MTQKLRFLLIEENDIPSNGLHLVLNDIGILRNMLFESKKLTKNLSRISPSPHLIIFNLKEEKFPIKSLIILEVLTPDIPLIFLVNQNIDTDSLSGDHIFIHKKPIEKARLQSKINQVVFQFYAKYKDDNAKITSKIFTTKELLFYKLKNTYLTLPLEEIKYIQSDDKYCIFHCKSKEQISLRIRILDLENMLPKEKFYRIHRKYIVQIASVETVDFNTRFLHLGANILPFSRTKKKEIHSILGKNNQ